MLGSDTIVAHAIRGVVGFAALTGAVLWGDRGWPALVLLPVALVALRGCPTCWLLGLGKAIVARIAGRDAGDACIDGRCASDAARGPTADAL